MARVALETERWLAFSHLIVGYVDTARTFGDPLIAGTDVIVHSEESYLAYSGASGRWGVQFGRSRWAWGPGQEGSLMLLEDIGPADRPRVSTPVSRRSASTAR